VFEARGITFGVVNRAEDVPDDTAFEDAGAIVPVGYEDGPMDRVVGSPVFMRGQDKVAPMPPPAVGEHNTDVLRELGYDEAEIKRLEDAGVVRQDATLNRR